MKRVKHMRLREFMVRYGVRGLDGKTIRLMQECESAEVLAYVYVTSDYVERSSVPRIWAVLFVGAEDVFGVVSGFLRPPQEVLQFIESWKIERVVVESEVRRLRFSWGL